MRVTYDTEHGKVFHAGWEEVLPTLPDECLDGLVTDGPYAMSILGKKWDQGDTRRFKEGYEAMDAAAKLCHRMANSVNIRGSLEDKVAFYNFNLAWAKECYRLMKPGSWGIAFGDGKTYHRLVSAIEDAGFTIKETIPWIYTRKNQPHGAKIDVLVDNHLGVERKVIGVKKQKGAKHSIVNDLEATRNTGGFNDPDRTEYNVTAPGCPESEAWDGYHTGLARANDLLCLFQKPPVGTLAENALKYGTAGINVEAAKHENGSWPSNVWTTDLETMGSASKFFLIQKASWAEKEAGLEDLPVLNVQAGKERRNPHPTPKPLALIRACVALIKPPTIDGRKPVILDQHFGSGTAGIASYQEGAYFIGIENDEEENYEALYLAKLRHYIK